MSLLSTYTNANKVEDTMLAVRYAVEYVESGYYRVTRTATKSYAYIGMTRTAAETCRTAKIAQYTHGFAREDSTTTRTVSSVTLPGIASVTECACECFARQDHGGSWKCEITVNEKDVLTVATPPSEPANLFTSWVASRSYDETATSAIFNIASAEVMNSKTWVTLTFDSTLIDDWDISQVQLFYKTSESVTTWTAATIDTYTTNQIATASNTTVGTLWMAKFTPYTSEVKASE